MAPRQRRGLAGLVTAAALLLATCGTGEGVGTVTTETRPQPSSDGTVTTAAASTPSTSTTTTRPPTTTTSTPAELPDLGAEVRVPSGAGPFPAVVLVHGGGWVAGDPSIIQPLADHLTGEGFLTVNTTYTLSVEENGFPAAVDDVACAVRYAAAHPDSNGSVAVVGHSAGAHLAAVVALTGDSYAADCPVDGIGLPDKLVGLAGPYDVERLGLVMLPFFGAGPSAEPEAWQAGNPQLLTDQNPDLASLIMYGENDGIVDSSFAIDFHNSLVENGSDSLLELVEGARHLNMDDPLYVGDLIVVWLER